MLPESLKQFAENLAKTPTIFQHFATFFSKFRPPPRSLELTGPKLRPKDKRHSAASPIRSLLSILRQARFNAKLNSTPSRTEASRTGANLS